MRVEFVSPDIVRVRYTREADFFGERYYSMRGADGKQGSFSGSFGVRGAFFAVGQPGSAGGFEYLCPLLIRMPARERFCFPSVRTCRARRRRRIWKNVVYDPDSRRIEKTADGEKEVMDVLRRDTVGWTWKFRNHFRWSEGEALYGLGCHMEDFLDLRGKTMYLCQHNLKEMVPVLNSTAGYGLLFDAGCGMKFQDGAEGGFMELKPPRRWIIIS